MVLLLLLALLAGAGAAPEPCCDIQTVEGKGALDGKYLINLSPSATIEDVCLNSCVYTKYGGPQQDEYCFKGTSEPGFAECSAVPTELPVTGSTEPPSAEGLRTEQAAVEAEVVKDELEMVALQEEEVAAAAVDAEIDGVQAKIDQLMNTTSGRAKRQAATSCTEIAGLVEEMGAVQETKEKLVIIRKITASSIISCTGEDDKQFLVVAKLKLKQTITQVKNDNGEIMKVIIKTKWTLQIKIVTNKKKIKNILEKLDIIENPKTTVPIVPTTKSPSIATQEYPKPVASEEPPKPTQAQTQESPKPMPTAIQETPRPMPTEEPKQTTSSPEKQTEGTPLYPTQGPGPVEKTTAPYLPPVTQETPMPMSTQEPRPSEGPVEKTTASYIPPQTQKTPLPMSTQEAKPTDGPVEKTTYLAPATGETPLPMPMSTEGLVEKTTASYLPPPTQETPLPMSTQEPKPTGEPLKPTTMGPTTKPKYTEETPTPMGKTPHPMTPGQTSEPTKPAQGSTRKPNPTEETPGWSSTGETPKSMTPEPTAKPVTMTPEPTLKPQTTTRPPGWSSTGETPKSMALTV